MRAIVIREPGDESVLQMGEAPSPVLGPADLRIRVRATAVNRADLLQRQGLYPPPPGASPILGMECAGEVVEMGPEARGFRSGQRVMALLPGGGYAEEAVVHHTCAMPVPDGMSDEEAGAFPVAYISSHVAIRWQGRLEAGETLLVLGAAGGVGLTAVEIGNAMGARVIAGASTPEKLAVAREHGADALVNYATENLTERVMALTDSKGADVCFDPVGGDLFDAALSALGWGGRILLVGFVGGVQQIAANRLLVKHRAALGSSLRYFRWHAPDKLQRSVDELLRWYAEGKLRPLITQRVPLERAIEAIRLLTDRKGHGKLVVLPEER